MQALHKLECVYQTAFLVDDVEEAARYWSGRGAGPFFAFNDFEFTEMLHPQQVSSPKLSILLGYSGDVMIELMQVIEDPTGLFSPPSLPVPHHVALLVDDIGDYLERRSAGDSLVMHALFPTGTPVAMLDTRAETGLLTELVTCDESVLGMIAHMRAEAESFTGEDLIRSFA
ncbi:MAG: methylmalonyl-CoA/ethylmalonyl-CoA epimerase [Halieaceae bacterium]|jgi:methylmalonyl-CoA/ethylmalonyl-CoA epimerase